MKINVSNLLDKVIETKGKVCNCIVLKVCCDECPFNEVDCTDSGKIYKIASSSVSWRAPKEKVNIS